MASESTAQEGEIEEGETFGIDDEEEWIAFPTENEGTNHAWCIKKSFPSPVYKSQKRLSTRVLYSEVERTFFYS